MVGGALDTLSVKARTARTPDGQLLQSGPGRPSDGAKQQVLCCCQELRSIEEVFLRGWLVYVGCGLPFV